MVVVFSMSRTSTRPTTRLDVLVFDSLLGRVYCAGSVMNSALLYYTTLVLVFSCERARARCKHSHGSRLLCY